MRLLIVEDDLSIANALTLALHQQGWAADTARTLEAAWLALRSEPFDVVLLDLTLPDGDGSTLLQRLRRADPHPSNTLSDPALPNPSTPVLIMTARDEVVSRVQGLDMGADDYLTKPFDALELTARIRAVQRRAAGRAQPVITYGEVQIDTTTRQVWRGGVPVDLSVREFTLLMVLLHAKPRVLTRQQIEARLYNWENTVESNTIEVHVHHLRRKLGAHMVRTLRGVGYFMPQEASGHDGNPSPCPRPPHSPVP